MGVDPYFPKAKRRIPFPENHLSIRKKNRLSERSFRNRNRGHGRHGFTLIEILVVIGIIAVLAAVVLVAINPSRQFKLARDSQRVSNVESILNAVGQNIAEHKGLFVCGSVTKSIPLQAADIRNDTSVSTSTGISGFDLAPCVVPAYISALPFDPSYPGGHYATSTDYDTGYVIYEDSDGRITASSTGEITRSISVTR